MLFNNKVLVTGANGFVGQALCEKLAASGVKVSCVVRPLKKTSLDPSRFNLIAQDLNQEGNYQDILSNVSVVIHLAARVHVMQDQPLNPLQDFLGINLHGTLNLAKDAAAAGVRRFVYVSSIKVNGEYTDKRAFTEQDAANPQGPYAISKWQGEQALMGLSTETGMEVVIVRPPLVYGPGVKANFLTLLNIVYKSIPLPLGKIKNRRSMIYVGNLVEALIICATHSRAAGQTYLVSDNEAISTPELVHRIALIFDKPVHIFAFPISMLRFFCKIARKTQAIDRLTESLLIDSSKICRDLDWKPPYTMADGLRETVTWYLQKIKSK